MGFLDQAKNVIEGKDPNTPAPSSADNRIDRVDQCKIVWYQWESELPTGSKKAFSLKNKLGSEAASASDDDLAKARSYDISNHIESVTYNKSMAEAAGAFSFNLGNGFDWARFMKPGQWVLIFFTKDGDLPLPKETSAGVDTTKLQGIVGPSTLDFISGAIEEIASAKLDKVAALPLPKGPTSDDMSKLKPMLRCMGIIQRVAVRSVTNVDGVVETSFVVTGKDFGAVYEDTELWFNGNNAEAVTYTDLIQKKQKEQARNLGGLLNIWHDIFLNFQKIVPPSITKVRKLLPNQWILPDQLVNDLDLDMDDGGKYFGDISTLKEFSPTIFENADSNLLSQHNGKMWDRLKGLSQPEYHELFTELSDNGTPKLYFRPIPWALDKSTYPVIGSLMLTYAQLASEQEVPPPEPSESIGAIVKNLSAKALSNVFSANTDGDTRLIHSVGISSVKVESYDLGADYHSRVNFFLVDSMKSIWGQSNAYALIAPKVGQPFPLRNENDIKRYGFKPKLINLLSFNLTNSAFFESKVLTNSASVDFMIEANEIMRDFYANADDFYTGTMTIANASNLIKLGKVLITDSSFQGIADMIFYIEGYSDVYSLNAEGTGSWTQTLNLTRGIQKSALFGSSTKDKQPTKAETFHTFNSSSTGSQSTLSKIKSKIAKPF